MSAEHKGLMDLTVIAKQNLGTIHRNLSTPRLVEEIVRNREGHLAHLGPVVVRTAHHADCAPADRYLITDETESAVPSLNTDQFARLFERILSYAQNRDIYVQDCHAGENPEHRVAIRLVTETAWHSLYARNLFFPLGPDENTSAYDPSWTIVHVPGFQAVPERDGTRATAFVLAHPAQGLVLIGGSSYAGELRQAVALITTALAPNPQVLPVRCAVNVGSAGDVAAFFGRTGNGKTALAADPARRLLGDHEHAWTEKGLFAYQRGCYAKVLDLDPVSQPAIHAATQRFGTILENTGLDHTNRRVRLTDGGLTSNQRACFPLSHLPQAGRSSAAEHPKNLFLLTRDSTGVLPAIARLDSNQAVFAFLTSYVSSLTETEAQPGDVTPDLATNTPGKAVLGALPPHEYAKRFYEKMAACKAQAWFINTGWIGEPMGSSERIPFSITRALIRAAIAGQLDQVPYETEPLFGFEIPTQCPGVDSAWLNPRERAADEGEYELRANQLAGAFIQGFERFGDQMPQSVRDMVANVVLYEETLDVMERFRLSF